MTEIISEVDTNLLSVRNVRDGSYCPSFGDADDPMSENDDPFADPVSNMACNLKSPAFPPLSCRTKLEWP